MNFEETFMKSLEIEIQNLIKDKDVFESKDKYTKLYMLFSIQNIIQTMQTQNQQLELMKQSQEMMKDVDFSKLDINGMLNTVFGK